MRTAALLAFVAAALYAKADDPWGLEHKDAYDVLKVPFDASREQIKQAYKARSKELHPDKLRKSDNEPFRQLRKAYDIVGFPRSKKKYDKEARKRHKHAPRRARRTRSRRTWRATESPSMSWWDGWRAAARCCWTRPWCRGTARTRRGSRWTGTCG